MSVTDSSSGASGAGGEPSAPLRARRFRTGRTVMALVLREMTTSYGRSPGGYVWAVLEPAAAVMLLSIGFSLMLRSPPLGTSFFLFYATGYLPFNLYRTSANVVAKSLTFSKPLLAYPGVTWVDAILARFLLNLLTQMMVACLVLGGALTVFDTHASLELPRILLGMGLAAFVGLGIGTLNCFLMGMVTLWSQVWGIVTRPLFLMSGIFYIYEDLPALPQAILWWNPVMHVNGIMRTGFYPTYDASYVSVPFTLGVATVTFVLGLILLGRFNRTILWQ